MMAALKGNQEAAVRLLDLGSKPHQQGWSPIHYAATGTQTQIVELLLDRGVPIDARSPNGTTPLMMAARYGAEATVNLLLARGAPIGQRNDRGLSAADFARLGGRDRLSARLESGAR
jgi:ankyrin repeat protein